jgi:hypothetical protein
MKRSIGVLAAVAVASLALSVITCTDGTWRAQPDRAAGATRLVAPSAAPGATALRASAATALARTRWTGGLHDAAMRDLVAHRNDFVRASDPRGDRLCLALERLARKYVPLIDDAAGVSRPQHEKEAAIRSAVAATRRCGNHGMSIFGQPRIAVVSRMPVFEDSATGAFDTHLQALQDGVGSTSATPAEVTPVAEGTVNAASGIPLPDLEIVAGAANLAIGSSQTWYSVGQGGGLDTLRQEPMSVLRQGWLVIFTAIVVADVGGCVSGIRHGWSDLGHRLPGVLLADCMVGAVVASAAAVLAE